MRLQVPHLARLYAAEFERRFYETVEMLHGKWIGKDYCDDRARIAWLGKFLAEDGLSIDRCGQSLAGCS